MDTLESTAQSFIVKVWVEDRAEGTRQGVWYGHITHIPTGQRHYLKDLDEVRDFIAPHLEAMGVRLGVRWRMKHWLKGLTGQD